MEPVYIYRATCHRVIDGDTFEAIVDLGFRVLARITVRIRGVDAFEHNKPGGSEATFFLGTVIENVPLLIRSYKDRQSFARWVCDVYLPDGTPLDEKIIVNKHGVKMER